MTDEPKKQIEPDELDEQEVELLPDREAMSIITPGFEQPVPVDGIIAPEPYPTD